MNALFKRDLITIKNLSKAEIDIILNLAQQYKITPPAPSLSNKMIAHCFFEASTRTRLSFETAALRLGAKTIGFDSDQSLSVQKGETLTDTLKVISAYADLIVIRHAKEGAAALAANLIECPVINAGDGANQHPTQALLDFFTIKECQNEINGLSIALVGDLKYGRAIHSFTQMCAHYDIRLYLLSPEHLSLPTSICDHLKKQGVRFSYHQDLAEIISKIDILYITRIQQERFTAPQSELFKNPYVINMELLKNAKANLKILHPLPRVNEIDPEVDHSPFAYYFAQAANGVYVRQAILTLLLNEFLP